jgi:hypothetical protein
MKAEATLVLSDSVRYIPETGECIVPRGLSRRPRRNVSETDERFDNQEEPGYEKQRRE